MCFRRRESPKEVWQGSRRDEEENARTKRTSNNRGHNSITALIMTIMLGGRGAFFSPTPSPPGEIRKSETYPGKWINA